MNDRDINGHVASGDDQQLASEAPVSPGARLAAYRNERGWTVEQVASQLNLAPRQVVAIESDDYPSLPGVAVTRGFIRAYAKLLKVDAAPLLATLGGEAVLAQESIVPRKTLSEPFSEARLPSMAERSRFSSKWFLGLVLLVLLIVFVWAVQGGLVKMAARIPTFDNDTPAKADATPLAQSTQNDDTAVESPVPQSADEKENAVQQQTTTAPQEADAPAIAATAPAVATAAPELRENAADTLVLKVTADSWIEIRREANNSVVLSRIVKAGETETFEVKEPLKVVLGNAGGVDMTLRGEPVRFKAGDGNIARLNLK